MLALYRSNGKENRNYYSISGLYRGDGQDNGTTIVYWSCIGVMEKKMETTIVYWGCTGVMEKKMELLQYMGLYRGNGKKGWKLL